MLPASHTDGLLGRDGERFKEPLPVLVACYVLAFILNFIKKSIIYIYCLFILMACLIQRGKKLYRSLAPPLNQDIPHPREYPTEIKTNFHEEHMTWP